MTNTMTDTEIDLAQRNERTISRLVEREVVSCASSLISDLARICCASGVDLAGTEIDPDAITGLFVGPPDFEAAGTDAGWRETVDGYRHDADAESSDAESWEELCDEQRLEAYSPEVLEHWIVTPWIARKLAERGEVVAEVCNLWIWGRTTSGQAISLDAAWHDIADGMEILAGQKNDWQR